MDFGTFMTFAVGCFTVLIMYIVRTTVGAKNKLREEALRQALERGEQQERRISELTRQTDQLHEQLEWHLRLLQSYERALGEPAAPASNGRTLAGRGLGRT